MATEADTQVHTRDDQFPAVQAENFCTPPLTAHPHLCGEESAENTALPSFSKEQLPTQHSGVSHAMNLEDGAEDTSLLPLPHSLFQCHEHLEHGNPIDALTPSLQTCPPTVSCCPKEESLDADLQTSDHVDVLQNLSIDEARTQTISVATDLIEPAQAQRDGADTLLHTPELDDQKGEVAANEEIQPNAQESRSPEKDGSEAAVPQECSSVMTSEVKAGGVTLDYPHVLSGSVDQQESNTFYSQNIVHAKEILQESNIPSQETEPCIGQVEEQNIQVKTTANKSEDENSSEQEMSDLGSQVSDQNKTSSEKEVLENETSADDNPSTAAGEIRQEDSTSSETITTRESSDSDVFQSKSEPNSSSAEEQETTAEKDEGSETKSENNTLREGETQSNNLEDDATDHSFPNRAENAEETYLVQVQDSQIECDKHLEEGSEQLPSRDISTGNTYDGVPPATHNVKAKDEDLVKADNEPSTRCLSVEENREIETPTENDELSNLSQNDSIQASPEEQSTDATLHGNTTEAEEATIDADDGQKEGLESCPPIVSSSQKEGSMNAVLQEVTGDHVDVSENLPINEAGTEINNVAPDIIDVAQEADQKVGSVANEERSVEDVQLNAEESNSNAKDGNGDAVAEQCSPVSPVMTSEVQVGDTLDEDDAKVVTQIPEDTSIGQHGTIDSYTENIAFTKEKLEETNIPSEEMELHTPCIREVEELDAQLKTTDNKSEDEKTTEQDMSCNEGESGQNKTTSENAAGEVSQEDSTSANTVATLEASNSDELQSRSASDSSFSKEQETSVEKGDRPVTASEDYGVPLGNTLSESHGDEECPSKSSEDNAKDNLIPNLAEKTEVTSLVQVEDSHLDEESERLPSTAVSTGATNDDVPPVTDIAEDKDEDVKEAELSENAAGRRSTLVKEDGQIESHAESLLVAPEDMEESSVSQESADATLHGEMNEVEEATMDAVDGQKEIDENLTTGEAHSEINNVAAVGDDTDTSLLSPKLVEFGAEEEMPAQVNSTEKGVVPEQCQPDPLVHVTSKETESQSPCITTTSELTEEQYKATSEQEVLAAVEDHSNTATEESSQENSASAAIVTAAQIGDGPVTTAQDCGVPCSSETHRDVECQHKTLEDAAADESGSKLAEKLEESALDQVEDSQPERDEHLEVEGERLPLTEALHVAPECIEESDSRQENKIEGSLEEQTSDADLHGNTIEAHEDSISEVVDQHKRSLENVAVEENSETNSTDWESRKTEEANVEKHVDSLQFKSEDLKNNSIAEQILNTNPPSDNAEREAVDAADTDEESLEAKGSSPGCDKDEESARNSEGGLMKDEESIESLRAAGKETVIEEPILGEDTETSCADEAKTDGAYGLEDGTPKDKQSIVVAESVVEEKESSVDAADHAVPSDDHPETPAEAVHVDGNTANEEEKDRANAPAQEGVGLESLQAADEDGEADSQGTHGNTIDLADAKEVVVEHKNYAATTDEDSLIQVDVSPLEPKEHSDKDDESKPLSYAPTDTITESRQVAEVEDPVDTETRSAERQILDAQDISSVKITEKAIEATSKETQEAQDVARSEDSPNVEDGSQKPPLVGIDEHESSSIHEVKLAEQSLIKADLVENGESREAAADDIKEPCLNEVRETNSQEEQIPNADSGGLNDDNRENKTMDVMRETSKDEEKTLRAEDLDVKEGISYKQQEASIAEVSEEHRATSNEHVPDNTSLESQVSMKTNDEVVGEANSCDDKTESEKQIVVSNDDETLAETDPRGNTGAEAQVPDGDNHTELLEAEIHQKSIIQDSSEENIERDAHSCLATPTDSGITEEVQKSKEVPLPAQDENIIETSDCKESDVAEGATNHEDIDHPEQDDTRKSFPDDQRLTEQVHGDRVAHDILLVSPSQTSAVDHYATEREITNGEGLCSEKTAAGDDEKEVCEETISDISSAAPDVAKLTHNSDNITDTAQGTMVSESTSVDCIIVNERSTTYPASRNGDEAPEIKETSTSSAQGQDVASAIVENANYPGSLTEEKSNSDEVAFTPGENRSGYESGDQSIVLADKTVINDTLEQEETSYDKEFLKDDISSKKEQFGEAEDEDIPAYYQGSYEIETIRDGHQEDEIKLEQQKTTNEAVEVTEDTSQTETTSKVSEEAEEKAVEDQEERTLTNEAIDKILHQEEQPKSIEEPTTEMDTIKAQALAIASVEAEIEDSTKEVVQIAIIPDKEIEEQNNEEEICNLDEVQAKDEENIVLSEGKSEEEAKEADTSTKPNEVEDKEVNIIEAKKLDFVSQTEGTSSECNVSDGTHIPEGPEDNEISSIKNYISEEDHPPKSTELDVSSASQDIALTAHASEGSIVTAEVNEAKAGISLGAAAPEATGIESQEVEEVNGQCAAMEETSTSIVPPVISTSKTMQEWSVETPLEADDQQTKVRALPQELNIKDSEVKMAEKDDVVNLQSIRNVTEGAQGLSKESFEASNNENPMGGDPEEKMDIKEPKEKKSAPHVTVSKTLEQETQEQQLGRGTESSIHQSSVEDTAQHEKGEGRQQIDSPLSLPQAQLSDTKTSEMDLLEHVAELDRIDAAEMEVTPLLSKEKHVVLEADGARNLNHESIGGDKNISTEYSQREAEIEKPSETEKEDAEGGNEERKDQEMEENSEPKETGKASLSELFQVSMRRSTQKADEPAAEEEQTKHTEDGCAENSDEAEHENLKTDEEKDEEEESHEERKVDLVSEAPVMVDMGDADVKVGHKKSHNILSGVGSKVKHSIAKVKKAITGKSSHPKTPSPKKVAN